MSSMDFLKTIKQGKEKSVLEIQKIKIEEIKKKCLSEEEELAEIKKIEEAEITADDILADTFLFMFEHTNKMSDTYMEFYSTQIEHYRKMKMLHYDSEPNTFFKKSHKKWEEKLEEIEDKLNKAYGNFNEEIEFKKDLIKIVKE